MAEVTQIPVEPFLNTSIEDCGPFFERLNKLGDILAIKLYRLRLDRPLAVPLLPCLDHEAMLHGGIPPHAAAYIKDPEGDLHEVVHIPAKRRIEVDGASTLHDCSSEGRVRFLQRLTGHFPDYRVNATPISWIKGDRRVADACRAQVSLHDVLLGSDLDRTQAAVGRLQTISSLMEKESRVASWAARTVMTPFVAVFGYLTYQVLGSLAPRFGAAEVNLVRSAVVTLVGGFFLYYGLKAVHLTEMANRVWKRSAEYGLILGDRRRLRR